MKNNYNHYHSQVLLPEIKNHIRHEKEEIQKKEERDRQMDKEFKNQKDLKALVVKINHDKLKEQMFENAIKKKQQWLQRYYDSSN